MKSIIIWALLSFLSSDAYASQPERLFYLTPDASGSMFSNDQLQNIKTHAKSIDILAPQIYEINAAGLITGIIDQQLITLANKQNLKVMPLVVNAHFDQEQLHAFLNNPDAQEKAIFHMLTLCQQYHFYGLQFDFEHIHVNDKQAFTQFYQATAQRLHKHHFHISIAMISRTSDDVYNEYDRWYYENWSGAFDYQALGKSSDFISIMSYDQHTSLTPPGPIAAIDWVEKIVQHLLKVVPAQKISLGIPDYSGYWSTGSSQSESTPKQTLFHSKEITLSYAKASHKLQQFNQPSVWQNQWKSSYVMHSNNNKLDYLFIEDAKSFRAKLALANRYKLRGISVWKFGLEDPVIWDNII